MENEDLARIGYQGYGESTGWKNYQGNPMPAWEDLGEAIQGAWAAAASAVVDALIGAFDDVDIVGPPVGTSDAQS